LVISLWAVPAIAEECTDSCTPCHGNIENIHANFNHGAAPGSGPVALFPDNGHDDAGWVGSRPFFAINVDCTLCHNTDLPLIHGNDCGTCHPTPFDTLGIWGKGCQQGGCHPKFHESAFKAHDPYESPYDPANDCSRCHQSWTTETVTPSACLNCHSGYAAGDVTPPMTTSNVLASYTGPAWIDFTVMEDGKVGVGRTFYLLDGGPATAAGKTLLISAPGSHHLEFWSKDQSGNTESAHTTATFTVVSDNTPPVTASNAQAAYNQGATITLTATDTGTMGVKQTYYRINGGAIQTGTNVGIPPTSGTFPYTLTFWSEDWAGNVETPKNASFTVTSGTGTLRLVWGNSDVSSSPCADDPEANAAWSIRRGSFGGPVVASGYGGCPNWDGFDDATVLAGSTPYFVIVDWYDSYWGVDDQTAFGNVYVTTPGQVVRLGY
jgi:hypothetical protein